MPSNCQYLRLLSTHSPETISRKFRIMAADDHSSSQSMTSPDWAKAVAARAQLCESATSLLAGGIQLYTAKDYNGTRSAAVLSCLALGCEYLLKATSLAIAEETNSDLKNATVEYKHQIFSLNQDVQGKLGEGDDVCWANTVSGHAKSDPYLGELLPILQDWADTAGRYQEINALIGSRIAHKDVKDRFNQLSLTAVVDLGLWDDLGPSSQMAARTGRLRISESMLLWWSGIYRSWQHGLAGNTMRAWASEIEPREDLLPQELIPCLKAM